MIYQCVWGALFDSVFRAAFGKYWSRASDEQIGSVQTYIKKYGLLYYYKSLYTHIQQYIIIISISTL